LVEQSWPREFLDWQRINIGLILGCGYINKREHNGQENPNESRQKQGEQKGAYRLATILISKAAYLI